MVLPFDQLDLGNVEKGVFGRSGFIFHEWRRAADPHAGRSIE
jgi:hypothetical protein